MTVHQTQPIFNSIDNQIVSYRSINCVNDQYFHNNNTLVTTELDLFIKFGQHLNEQLNFEIFNQYYLVCKNFKNKLNLILLDYYENLDNEDIDNQMKNLKNIIILIDNLHLKIVDFNVHNEKYYSNRFSNYFRIGKSKLDDLDPNNFQCVVSKIQYDWAIKIRNLENLYNNFVAINNKPVKKQNMITYSGFLKMIGINKDKMTRNDNNDNTASLI